MDMNSKILFLFAHPDDEAYGPAGTIAKLSQENQVIVVSLCNGARPGNEHVADARASAFVKSCEMLGAEWKIYNTPDCALTYDDTLKTIELLVEYCKPDIIYTHNISDIHRDHRLVAECCIVASRPKPNSTVKELYFCEMPSSTAWSFGKFEPLFNPNVFKDITDFIEIKKQVLELYITETYKFPDARSVEAVEILSKYRGYQSGITHAEAFQLVFSHDQTPH
jgi:hypothetical protein